MAPLTVQTKVGNLRDPDNLALHHPPREWKTTKISLFVLQHHTGNTASKRASRSLLIGSLSFSREVFHLGKCRSKILRILNWFTCRRLTDARKHGRWNADLTDWRVWLRNSSKRLFFSFKTTTFFFIGSCCDIIRWFLLQEGLDKLHQGRYFLKTAGRQNTLWEAHFRMWKMFTRTLF